MAAFARILDSTNYAGRPDRLHPSRHLARAFTPTGHQLGSAANYDERARAIRGLDAVATLDLEWLGADADIGFPATEYPYFPGNPQTPWLLHTRLFARRYALEQFRARLGPGWLIGAYPLLPTPANYPAAVHAAFVDPAADAWRRDPNHPDVKPHLDKWHEWRQGNDAIAKELLPHMDFLCPQLYVINDVDRRNWTWLLAGVAEEAERVRAGKPVYAFLMTYWWEADNNPLAGQPIPYDFFRHQLETCLQRFAGVVLWGGHGSAFDPEAGWARATRDVLEAMEPAPAPPEPVPVSPPPPVVTPPVPPAPPKPNVVDVRQGQPVPDFQQGKTYRFEGGNWPPIVIRQSGVTIDAIDPGNPPCFTLPLLPVGKEQGAVSTPKGAKLADLTFRHLLLRAAGREAVPKSGRAFGFDFQGAVDALLVEDCDASGFAYNIHIVGRHKNPRFVGGKYNYAWAVTVTPKGDGTYWGQGCYSNGTVPPGGTDETNGPEGLTFEGVLFERNGWHPNVAGAQTKTQYRHHLYLGRATQGTVLRRCVFSRAAAVGAQMRFGGTVEECFFYDSAIHILAIGPAVTVRDSAFVGGHFQFKGKDDDGQQNYDGHCGILDNAGKLTATGNVFLATPEQLAEAAKKTTAAASYYLMGCIPVGRYGAKPHWTPTPQKHEIKGNTVAGWPGPQMRVDPGAKPAAFPAGNTVKGAAALSDGEIRALVSTSSAAKLITLARGATG